jgi:putative oxidoreductase
MLRRAEPYGQSTVLLGLRLIYGWQFAQTGWGKLMNLERTGGFFESIGIPAPLAMAALVGMTELIGGLMFALGAGTRFAAAALVNVMVVALLTAHADEAFSSLTAFTEQAPYPFLVTSLLLLVFGAGWFSVDGWFRSRSKERTGSN